uniref:Uncharacterized protein n=1 Tax=Chromera velia CCMP2878 TaxID=1169474 RepID=A0A0G4FQC0_9ALVE|eukprot:Cvel_3616.t1-p1 / transcript=Cvel_3616.t1 / gene=Cvel_3616 / organism=Chromera_velia_CCMP2878 / gene_product=hypothetical protein / transcript_product=hypothetical protein / location=Cvel_scaffold148:79995-81491(-) / protein_length=499 / sequence_SO=supercontig / SO=protein_coding / is_pseudo=false
MVSLQEACRFDDAALQQKIWSSSFGYEKDEAVKGFWKRVIQAYCREKGCIKVSPGDVYRLWEEDSHPTHPGANVRKFQLVNRIFAAFQQEAQANGSPAFIIPKEGAVVQGPKSSIATVFSTACSLLGYSAKAKEWGDDSVAIVREKLESLRRDFCSALARSGTQQTPQRDRAPGFYFRSLVPGSFLISEDQLREFLEDRLGDSLDLAHFVWYLTDKSNQSQDFRAETVTSPEYPEARGLKIALSHDSVRGWKVGEKDRAAVCNDYAVRRIEDHVVFLEERKARIEAELRDSIAQKQAQEKKIKILLRRKGCEQKIETAKEKIETLKDQKERLESAEIQGITVDALQVGILAVDAHRPALQQVEAVLQRVEEQREEGQMFDDLFAQAGNEITGDEEALEAELAKLEAKYGSGENPQPAPATPAPPRGRETETERERIPSTLPPETTAAAAAAATGETTDPQRSAPSDPLPRLPDVPVSPPSLPNAVAQPGGELKREPVPS